MNWLSRTWENLVRPHSRITDEEEQKGARLFAALMLFDLGITGVLLFVANLYWVWRTGLVIWDDLDFRVIVAGSVITLFGYLALRSGFYRAGVSVFLAALALVVLVAPFVPDPSAEIGLIALLIVPVLLSALVFEVRWIVVILFLLLTATAIRIFSVELPLRTLGTAITLLFITGIIGGLLIVFQRHTRWLEGMRNRRVHESDERYRLLFDRSLDCVYIHDLEGRFIDANEAALRLLGYSRKDLLHLTIRDILHPDHHEAISGFFAEVVRSGPREELLPLIVRTKGGGERRVEVSTVLVQKEGRPWAIQGIARDVTDRRRVEDVLRRKVESLRTVSRYSAALASVGYGDDVFAIAAREIKGLLDALAVSLSTYDRAASQLVLRAVTLSEEESSVLTRMIGRTILGMRFAVSPEMYARIVAEGVGEVATLHEATFGGIPAAVGSIIESQFGAGSFTGIALKVRDELIGTIVVVGRKGRAQPAPEDLEAIGGVTANAIARWMAEKGSIATEARYKLMTENMKDVIFQLTPDLRFVYVSPSIRSFLGYAPEQVVGRSIFDFLSPDSSREVAALVEKRRAEAAVGRIGSIAFETELVCADGRGVWAEVVSNPVYDAGDRVTGFQGISRDIAERKRGEEELRASLREKEVLLKEIHHRVKNNLQVISSLLSLQAGMSNDRRITETLQESQNRVKSMALVHERLYRSKNMANVDFNEYVRSVSRELMHSYRREDVGCSVEGESLVLGIDQAIPGGLILNELVSNALKHGFPEGRPGKIRIVIERSALGVARLTVCDDGVGFPEGRDFRAANSMGMILLVGLTDQLDGTVRLEREGGTKFIVEFPIDAKKG